MSLLGDIGRGISNVASAIVKPLAAATPFVPALAPITAVAGIINRIAPSAGSPVKVPTPQVPTAAPPSFSGPIFSPQASYSPVAPSAMSVQNQQANVGIGDVIRGAIGGAAGAIGGGVINSFIPTLTGQKTGSCGCNGGSHGRDPCTHQRLGTRNNPAPLATFFGGCCPPGRVLRRKPMGRDICIKQPRMNVFNPRALARADMRITGFVRRAAPILADMGFHVQRHRHLSGVKTTKGKRRGRR